MKIRVDSYKYICRNCDHADFLHVKTYYYHCGRDVSTIWDEACPCKEFVPSDNLEYLEYCEAKRNSK
jgi:hypothetical protein